LHDEKIPATLFITGKWIDANFPTLLKLGNNTYQKAKRKDITKINKQEGDSFVIVINVTL